MRAHIRARYKADLAAVQRYRPAYKFWQHIYNIPDGRIIFGSAEDGDLVTDLGCRWSAEGTELLYARSKVLLEARAAGIEHPLDGVFLGLDDEEGLLRDAENARRLLQVTFVVAGDEKKRTEGFHGPRSPAAGGMRWRRP